MIKPQRRKVFNSGESKKVGYRQSWLFEERFLSFAKTIKDGLPNRVRFALRNFAPFNKSFLVINEQKPYTLYLLNYILPEDFFAVKNWFLSLKVYSA